MASENPLDLTTLQNLVDLDEGSYGLVQEMIDIFKNDTPRRIQDILWAVEARDAEALSRAGHALKGGAGALGARPLRALGADLEHLGRSGSVNAGADLPARLDAAYQASLAALEAYVRDGAAPKA